MKTKAFILLNVFVCMFIVLSCQKPEITPDGVEPDMLTKYSWRECKFVVRSIDSSLYDFSYMYLSDKCDTNIYSYNDDGKCFVSNLCDTIPDQMWWKFSQNYSGLEHYYIENSNDYVFASFKIEKLSKDTLKLLIINSDDTNESFSGIIIYYYSVPKEEHQ